MASLKARFERTLCAPGADKDSIESRYTRLSGKLDGFTKSSDLRLPSEKDRDRLLYSQSFRRLGEITQVIPRERGYVLHNRLTHTLKVAQLGRRMAERLLLGEDGRPNKGAIDLANKLGGLDPNVVEAAALAHDLGHPPFGHVIEKFLDERTRSATEDGFEGNAQSFRIITFLENRDAVTGHRVGMDLSLASVNATLKYPWGRDTSSGAHGKKANKFGYYTLADPDKDHFETVRSRLSRYCGGDGNRSLEAELMDWADDIAYAIYDVDDFYRAGLLPLEKILRECFEFGEEAHLVGDENEMPYLFKETELRWKGQGRDQTEIDQLKDGMRTFCAFVQKTMFSLKSLKTQKAEVKTQQTLFKSSLSLQSAYRGTDEQRYALALLTSALVEEFTAAIYLNCDAVDNCAAQKVTFSQESKMIVKILKELTWTYVIDNPDLHAVQWGQKQVVEMVFNTLLGATKGDKKLLPRNILDRLTHASNNNRLVTDLVAGMTESQIADLYGRFTGMSAGSLLRSTYIA